jgi:hypothetical protein
MEQGRFALYSGSENQTNTFRMKYSRAYLSAAAAND